MKKVNVFWSSFSSLITHKFFLCFLFLAFVNSQFSYSMIGETMSELEKEILEIKHLPSQKMVRQRLGYKTVDNFNHQLTKTTTKSDIVQIIDGIDPSFLMFPQPVAEPIRDSLLKNIWNKKAPSHVSLNTEEWGDIYIRFQNRNHKDKEYLKHILFGLLTYWHQQ